MEPTISVIVPIFNAEKYLNKCIDSIKKQTYSKLEIILVDDGSTDQSPFICNELAKSDIRIKVIHKQNKGVFDSRNVGLKAATGSYISFVDSDDFIHPDMISSLYKAITDTNSLCSMCKGLRVYDDSISHNQATQNPALLNQDEILKRLFSGDADYVQYVVVWNKLFQKDILQNIQFNDLIISEDTDFMIRVYSRIEKVAFIDRILYYWVQRNDSLSHNIVRRNAAYELKVWSSFINYIDLYMPTQKIITYQGYCLGRLYKKIVHARFYAYETDFRELTEQIVKEVIKKTLFKFLSNPKIVFKEKATIIFEILFPSIYRFLKNL